MHIYLKNKPTQYRIFTLWYVSNKPNLPVTELPHGFIRGVPTYYVSFVYPCVVIWVADRSYGLLHNRIHGLKDLSLLDLLLLEYRLDLMIPEYGVRLTQNYNSLR